MKRTKNKVKRGRSFKYEPWLEKKPNIYINKSGFILKHVESQSLLDVSGKYQLSTKNKELIGEYLYSNHIDKTVAVKWANNTIKQFEVDRLLF